MLAVSKLRTAFNLLAHTIKQGRTLAKFGVADPDTEWGEYVLLRQWDEKKFLSSLRSAERTPIDKLNADGNRAVMFCTTTDPYQVIHHPDSVRRKALSLHSRHLVRRALELIRDESSLNVRILTRSPMARLDFDLYRSFGNRLVFGMSLPTLRNDLSKIYEPKAPAPTQRLPTLIAAKQAGLHVYVAMAPTYPESDENDIRATLKAIANLDPITIFHEPINLRADNAARIALAASKVGIPMLSDVFKTRQAWQMYALEALQSVWRISSELGIRKRILLWPDAALSKPLQRDESGTRSTHYNAPTAGRTGIIRRPAYFVDSAALCKAATGCSLRGGLNSDNLNCPVPAPGGAFSLW
jgi:DNA repair photolyase